MAGKSPQPPKHLSARATKLWRDVVPRRARSPERVALVRAALEALERADEARAAIAREGLTFTTESTGAVHVHPAVKVEKDARAQFVTAWRALEFDYDSDGDPNRFGASEW